MEIKTLTLVPGDHLIATECDEVRSLPALLTVLATKEVPRPIVECAMNANPRDGLAVPLTSGASSAEEASVVLAKRQSEKLGKSYPLPEELGRLLGRCASDWAWTVRLDDRLRLKVTGLSDWAASKDNGSRVLHLFVDGIELTNVSVKQVKPDPAMNADIVETLITFEDLGPAEGRAAGRSALAQILRAARAKNWSYGASDLEVSIGPAHGPQFATKAKLRINPYPPAFTAFGVLAAVTLVILLVVLGRRTTLLRDRGDRNAPFSLAKNQMALWFVVIVGAFLFVTVTTGQAASLSSTALALIGISGATGLVAVAMDRRKTDAATGKQRALEAERAALMQSLDGPGGMRQQRKTFVDGSPTATDLDGTISKGVQRLGEITKELEATALVPLSPSAGWLTDVLSDDKGISFHRLQMATWTIVMAGVFVVGVWRTFAMAEFDTTMLGLLGISSGTYLGFKFPERAVAD